MNSKNRATRVQGGWSQPARTKMSTTRSDDNKSKLPQAPAWLGNNVDPPKEDSKFVFEQPNEVLTVEPAVKVLEQNGVYELSTTENGVSRVRILHNFILPKECDEIFENLFHELPWKQRSDVKNGQSYLQPRLTAWFGDVSYSYSGVTHSTNTKWNTILLSLLDQLEGNMGIRFNSMLANLYRDGHDSVAWHADDEPALGTNPTIASLSFGDTRVFEMRRKPPKGTDPLTYSPTEIFKVPIPAGTLLIMDGATQEDWQHRIPREYHDRSPRINLTFRTTFQV